MDPFIMRVHLARSIREAADCLLEASERASDLQRFNLSCELLDQSVKTLELANDVLKLESQIPTQIPGQERMPF